MNIYPEQMRQIVAYCVGLNQAEGDIGWTISDGMTVQLKITVTDETGDCILGEIVDEIGGSWSFEAAT